MRYFTQWEDAEIGSSKPRGWTRRWVTSTETIAPTYSTPKVQRRILRHSTTVNFPSPITWDLIDTDQQRANVEVLVLCSSPAEADVDFLVFARGSGAAAAETCYYARYSIITNRIRLLKRVAGVQTGLTDTGTRAGADMTNAWWLRFSVQTAAGSPTLSTITARAWAYGTTEPSTWDTSTTDASVQSAGWVGLQGLNGTNAADFNFFSVGTDGSTAVTPLTNDEYYAWLDRQDVQKAILAEISYIGGSVATSDFTKAIPIYLSTSGYKSHAEDTPSNRYYPPWIAKIPTLSREIGIALKGQTSLGFGSFQVHNPREGSDESAGGVRDNWLRRRWKKTAVKLWIGDDSWPRHDFRPYLVGRLGVPTATTDNMIDFPILEFSDAFNEPIQDRTFREGPSINTYKPLLIGSMAAIEPPLEDATARIYRISDLPIKDFCLHSSNADKGEVYDEGNSLSQRGMQATVNTGTDVITLIPAGGGDHGLLPLAVLIWSASGTMPSPLVALTKYYVKTVPSSSTVTISATPGGATIDLTTNPSPAAQLDGMNWEVQPADGTLTLVTDAAGRIVVQDVKQAGTDASLIPDMMAFCAFSSGPLGSELISNPDFMIGTTGWTATGATVTSQGLVTFTTSGQSVTFALSDLIIGRRYRFSGNIIRGTLAVTSVVPTVVGVGDLDVEDDGTFNGDFVATSASHTVGFTTAAGSPSLIGTFVIDSASVKSYGLSENYKDQQSFDALELAMTTAAGRWVDTAQHTVGEVIAAIADGAQAFYGFTPDGLMQVGRLDLPDDEPVDGGTFTSDDFEAGSLAQTNTVLPIDFSKTDVTFNPTALLGGAYLVDGVELIERFDAKKNYGPPAIVTDEPPWGDTQPKAKYATNFYSRTYDIDDEKERLVTLFTRSLGIFTFKARMSALRLNIGDTIRLTAPRLGWKIYGPSTPSSSNNVGAFDASLAVVSGIGIDLSEDGAFKVRLTVYRQLPQYAGMESDDINLPNVTWDPTAYGMMRDLVGGAPISFTRNDTKWFENSDGNLELVGAGEMTFDRMRRVKNLAAGSSSDLNNASWTKTNATISADGTTATATAGNATVMNSYTPLYTGSRAYFIRMKVTRISGSGGFVVRVQSSDITSSGSTYTTGVPRVIEVDFSTSTTPFSWGFKILTSGNVFKVEELQIEDYTGNSYTHASEYVPVGAARSNMVTYSEQMDLWALAELTVTKNASFDGAGRKTLDKLIPSVVNTSHFAVWGEAKTATARTYTVEFDVIAAGYNFARAFISDAGPNVGLVDINLVTGAVTPADSGFTGTTAAIQDLTGGLWRVTLTSTSNTVTSIAVVIAVANTLGNTSFAGDGVSGISVGRVHVWEGTVASRPTYVPVGNVYPYYGAFVDGVKYFGYANGNELGEGSSLTHVDADGGPLQVTTGVRGMRRDRNSTNEAIRNRDLSNAAWTATGSFSVRSRTSQGADGMLNAASRILCGAGTGQTILQAIASASNTKRTFSFRAYAVSYGTLGPGHPGLEVTMDNGATWTFIKIPIGQEDGTGNALPFRRYFVQQTLANPTVGFRFSGLGAEFIIDFTQEEPGNATADIETFAAAVTRTNPDLMYYATPLLDKREGTTAVELGFVQTTPLTATVSVFHTGEASAASVHSTYISSEQVRGFLGADRATYDTHVVGGRAQKIVHRWSSRADDVWVNGARGTAAAGSTMADDAGVLYIGTDQNGVGESCTIGRGAVWRRLLSDDQAADVST